MAPRHRTGKDGKEGRKPPGPDRTGPVPARRRRRRLHQLLRRLRPPPPPSAQSSASPPPGPPSPARNSKSQEPPRAPPARPPSPSVPPPPSLSRPAAAGFAGRKAEAGPGLGRAGRSEDRTGPDRTGPDRTGPDRTAPQPPHLHRPPWARPAPLPPDGPGKAVPLRTRTASSVLSTRSRLPVVGDGRGGRLGPSPVDPPSPPRAPGRATVRHVRPGGSGAARRAPTERPGRRRPAQAARAQPGVGPAGSAVHHGPLHRPGRARLAAHPRGHLLPPGAGSGRRAGIRRPGAAQRFLHEPPDGAAPAGHRCLLLPGDPVQPLRLPPGCLRAQAPSPKDHPPLRLCPHPDSPAVRYGDRLLLLGLRADPGPAAAAQEVPRLPGLRHLRRQLLPRGGGGRGLHPGHGGQPPAPLSHGGGGAGPGAAVRDGGERALPGRIRGHQPVPAPARLHALAPSPGLAPLRRAAPTLRPPWERRRFLRAALRPRRPVIQPFSWKASPVYFSRVPLPQIPASRIHSGLRRPGSTTPASPVGRPS